MRRPFDFVLEPHVSRRQPHPRARTVSTAGLVLAVTGLALPAAARGAVLDVPLVYPGIQQAVDAAAPGDVIRVGAGTYQEHVRVRGDKAAITIEGADAHAMPVLLGTANKSADGIRVDEVDRITLRNLRIVGAYDGVRLNRVVGAVVSGLVIEDTALGIRINRGADNVVVANTIFGTRGRTGHPRGRLAGRGPDGQRGGRSRRRGHPRRELGALRGVPQRRP